MFKILSSNAVVTVMPSGYYYYCEGMFHLIFVCKKTKMGRGGLQGLGSILMIIISFKLCIVILVLSVTFITSSKFGCE